jgi:hypothetical protein
MKGISQLISFVLTILISITALSIFVFAINPTLQRMREEGYLNQAFEGMKSLVSMVEDVATEGIGSSRKDSFSVPEGEFFVRNDTNSLEYKLIASADVLPNGTNITKENIQFISTQLSTRPEVEIKLVYSNQAINITNYERLPKGSYSLCIKKVGESSGRSLIEVKSC